MDYHGLQGPVGLNSKTKTVTLLEAVHSFALRVLDGGGTFAEVEILPEMVKILLTEAGHADSIYEGVYF